MSFDTYYRAKSQTARVFTPAIFRPRRRVAGSKELQKPKAYLKT